MQNGCWLLAGTDRKLCEDSLAVPGLEAGQVGMVCGGEADAGHIHEAAAVIRHGCHVLQQAEGVHTVCSGYQGLQHCTAFLASSFGKSTTWLWAPSLADCIQTEAYVEATLGTPDST